MAQLSTPINSYSLAIHLLVLLIAMLYKQIKKLSLKLRRLIRPAKSTKVNPAIAGVNLLQPKAQSEIIPNQQ